jgi:hypothetical protein
MLQYRDATPPQLPRVVPPGDGGPRSQLLHSVPSTPPATPVAAAPPCPSPPTSLVFDATGADQAHDDVGDGEFPFQADDYVPPRSPHPPPFGHDGPIVHPSQESVVSETQPDYLSTPAAARLLSNINLR